MASREAVSLGEIIASLATALQTISDEVPGLQVYAGLNTNPTPPSIDVYPGSPFQTGAGFGTGSSECFFTVRARVSTADQQAGNQLLVRLMDPNDPASVEAAIDDLATVVPDGVSGFQEYLEDAAENGRLLGCEWRVSVFL